MEKFRKKNFFDFFSNFFFLGGLSFLEPKKKFFLEGKKLVFLKKKLKKKFGKISEKFFFRFFFRFTHRKIPVFGAHPGQIIFFRKTGSITFWGNHQATFMPNFRKIYRADTEFRFFFRFTHRKIPVFGAHPGQIIFFQKTGSITF